VLTAPTLCKVRHRLGAAAGHCPSGPGQSGPAATPPVWLMELEPSCAASAVVGDLPWQSVGPREKMVTAT
jgi:hypothetical protein